jgi:tetratricopeptide (TPR) repeat protein
MARPLFPVWLIAALLALVTIGLYWPATSHDFIVNFDDDLVVTSNVHVQGGLNWEGVKWAFFNPVNSIWNPLTILSHMLDCQLFGLKPWGHHLTSMLLHAVNTVLVFVLLQQLTGARWRSAMVAVLFGLHPLHVESVAWVAERKDMLSTCFGLLALIFYAGYTRRVTSDRCQVTGPEKVIPAPVLSRVTCLPVEVPLGGTKAGHPAFFYALALLFFALGLMSKPMLVTWPFVMLLLDYWPLERFKLSNVWQLVTEKIPFFALMVTMSIVTFVVQKQANILASVENLPLSARSGNALISYCRYLGKLFWPTDLAVIYPHPGYLYLHPEYWPMEQVLLAGGLILGITVLFIVKKGRYPFLLMGWLWYCGTLVPAIQLVQTGEHAMADRYAYIPSLGVLILAIWGAYELTRRWRYHEMALSVTGCAAIVLCLGMTWQQLGYWKDNETLFRHALEVTENNYVAHNGLGFALGMKGQTDEAINQFQEAIRLAPDFAKPHNNLGFALDEKGQTDEAIDQFLEAIKLEPDLAEAHNNLGAALGRKGQTDEAINQFQEAIRLNPDFVKAHNNLGTAFLKKDQIDEAISQFVDVIRLNPNFVEAHYVLGTALSRKGQTDEAIDQFQEAIRLKPDFVEAHYNLGTALGMKGQTDEAINQFQEAIRLKPNFFEAHYNLGTALGRKGQIDGAISQYRETIQLKPDFADAHGNLAKLLATQGKLDEAVKEYQRTLELVPDSAQAHYKFGQALQGQRNFEAAMKEYQKALDLAPQHLPAHLGLAWLLATCPDNSLRNGKKAVELAEQAGVISGTESSQQLDTLAAAYAEAGRFSEAVATATRALNLTTNNNDKPLVDVLTIRLKLYEVNSPYHEKP